MSASTQLALDLSGVGVTLDGLESGLRQRLVENWSAFVVAPSRQAGESLAMRVSYERRDAATAEEFAPKRMRARLELSTAHYTMPEGEVRVEEDGRAEARIAHGLGRRELYTFVNLLRAALAWHLPRIGGLMLHAAGVVLGAESFLLVGPEGCGKSTWARLAESSGARVVSDDVVLLHDIEGTPRMLGSPFWSTHAVRPCRGRWPLRAVLLPRHGSSPALEPAPPSRALASLVANLPFLDGAPQGDDRAVALVLRLTEAVAPQTLTFSLDPGFVDLLRGAAG
ncbi:MAG: hypothetical protein GY716_24355 [bacterium]|nr:hypothetical protein [bacterium]